MQELEPSGEIDGRGAEFGEVLEAGGTLMIIEAVACLSAAARGIVPFQAVEDPERIPGFRPPFIALRVLGVGKLYIILIVICLRLFPGAELEYILLVMGVCLRPADWLLLN